MGLGCGLEEKVASSHLPCPAGGVSYKVLVPANNLQAINYWVHLIWSGHFVTLGLKGEDYGKGRWELDPNAVTNGRQGYGEQKASFI